MQKEQVRKSSFATQMNEIKDTIMSKGSTEDITRRKRAMIAEALKTVNAMEDDNPTVKPKRETVSLEEALKAETLTNQAIINLLVSKGFITQEELFEEIKELRRG